MASGLKISERDTNQRSLGCVGFSVIAHFGLLGVLLFTPPIHSELEGLAAGGGSSSSSQNMKVELAGDANAPSQPNHEVLLAEATDESAVALPEKPVAKPKPVELPKAMPPKKVATNKAAVAAKPIAKLISKPVMTEETPDALFQPESIADADPSDKLNEPELLTPVISDATNEEPASDEIEPQAVAEKEEMPAPVRETVREAPKAAVAPAPKAAAPAPQQAVASAPAASQGSNEGSSQGPPSQGQKNGGIASGGAGPALGASPEKQQIVDSSLRNPLPGNPLPAYPQQDQFAGRQGTATVVGRVSPNGTVDDVVIERSSGSPMMDRAAVDTFKKWKFANGPEARVRKGFAFTLTGEAKLVRAKLGGR